MPQLIGTYSKYINFTPGEEIDRHDCWRSVRVSLRVHGTIREFSVYVPDNPEHPNDVVYTVKVVDTPGIGTKTDVNLQYPEISTTLEPVDESTTFMEFSLFKNILPLEEHYTNVKECDLPEIFEDKKTKKFVGKTSRTNYVLQFNKYLREIWSQKPDLSEQKECPHTVKRQRSIRSH